MSSNAVWYPPFDLRCILSGHESTGMIYSSYASAERINDPGDMVLQDIVTDPQVPQVI